MGDVGNWPILTGAAVSLIVWAGMRRSRYFGNTAPLLVFLAIVFLTTTQVFSAPWLWALPFLLTFIGGVFADALETRQRRLFLGLTAALLAAQAAACLTLLPRLS